jgi:hypothetical protein
MATELQVVLAIGATLGLAQAPIAMGMQSPSHCSSHEKPAPYPDKSMTACHACTLPKPDDEDDD